MCVEVCVFCVLCCHSSKAQEEGKNMECEYFWESFYLQSLKRGDMSKFFPTAIFFAYSCLTRSQRFLFLSPSLDYFLLFFFVSSTLQLPYCFICSFPLLLLCLLFIYFLNQLFFIYFFFCSFCGWFISRIQVGCFLFAIYWLHVEFGIILISL